MIWSPRPGFTVLTFRGSPPEMRAMWNGTACGLAERAGLFGGGVFSRAAVLRFWGIGEIQPAERWTCCWPWRNPTVAPMQVPGGEAALTAPG